MSIKYRIVRTNVLCGIIIQGVHVSCQTDIDECARDIDDCSEHAACSNTMGSFECRCNDGYNGDGVNCDGSYIKNV